MLIENGDTEADIFGDNTATETEILDTTEKEPEVKDSLSEVDDETPEEKEEREAAEAKLEREKRIRIPKARFDEQREKFKTREEQYQARIAELERAQAQAGQTVDVRNAQKQLDELSDKYEDLVMDGRKEDARAVRRQMEQLRDQLTEFKTNTKAEHARKAAIEDLRFDAALEKAESTFDVLNPKSDNFDEATTNEVAELMEGFILKGASRAAALDRAVRYVLGTPPKAAGKDAGDVTKQRAEDARRKAAEANRKQPGSLSKVGIDSDKAGSSAGAIAGVDIMKMSQDKFAKIDEDTLAKLRGDDV